MPTTYDIDERQAPITAACIERGVAIVIIAISDSSGKNSTQAPPARRVTFRLCLIGTNGQLTEGRRGPKISARGPAGRVVLYPTVPVRIPLASTFPGCWCKGGTR